MTNEDPKGRNDHRRAALEALEAFKSEEATRQQKKEVKQEKKGKKKKIWITLQCIVLLIGIAVIAFQAPSVISSVTKEEKPHRQGTFDTDKRTDECINNLWKISALLQQGKLPGKNILCPASQKPYLVTESEDDIIVSSPNPELYGFKEIKVSKKGKVPKLIK